MADNWNKFIVSGNKCLGSMAYLQVFQEFKVNKNNPFTIIATTIIVYILGITLFYSVLPSKEQIATEQLAVKQYDTKHAKQDIDSIIYYKNKENVCFGYIYSKSGNPFIINVPCNLVEDKLQK